MFGACEVAILIRFFIYTLWSIQVKRRKALEVFVALPM